MILNYKKMNNLLLLYKKVWMWSLLPNMEMIMGMDMDMVMGMDMEMDLGMDTEMQLHINPSQPTTQWEWGIGIWFIWWTTVLL